MKKFNSLPDFMTQGSLLPNFTINKIKRNKAEQIGLFTTTEIKQNEILFQLDGRIINYPTKYSIQIGKDKHIEDKHVGYMNHSCKPNTQLSNNAMIALKFISTGEELTFDYNTTEDLLASPFDCSCCGKRIAGKFFDENIVKETMKMNEV